MACFLLCPLVNVSPFFGNGNIAVNWLTQWTRAGVQLGLWPNFKSARFGCMQAMPWATELDPAPRPPQPYGRKHVQYLPRQLEGFGARVDRGFPF